MAKRNQAVYQNLLDCGNNFIAVLFPTVSMPWEKALYMEYLDDFCQGIVVFKAAKEDAARKVITIKLDLDVY